MHLAFICWLRRGNRYALRRDGSPAGSSRLSRRRCPERRGRDKRTGGNTIPRQSLIRRLEGPLSDEDAPIVSEIRRRTDGIALAIELVASRVGAYGIRGVASLLADDAELSLDGQRNAAPRHRTLQATLDGAFGSLKRTSGVF